MQVLNFGSVNMDVVFQVEHIVRPGETISSYQRKTHAGGKGANQSVALARAGVKVFHAGRVGNDGRWLLEKLGNEGVDVKYLEVGEDPTGQAMIQVDTRGQNSIVLFAGANRKITDVQAQYTIEHFSSGDVLLLQNEINRVDHIMRVGNKRGMSICFNPAPMGAEVMNYPLELVNLLVLNETEGAALTRRESPADIIKELHHRYPKAEIILTLGEQGVRYQSLQEKHEVPAVKVRAIDTTAAGDTFIGYYLACRGKGMNVNTSLRVACQASALCVTKPGAMDSIPRKMEVKSFVNG
ncbi:MAG: ribokinase [Phycisphaerales bacterium]|nr:ribokinase [Phycisphaerales bacterium]